MTIERAIAELEDEVASIQGKLTKADVGTKAWWRLRALSTGLSLLRTIKAAGITDPRQADSFRKDVRLRLLNDPLAATASDSASEDAAG